MVSKERLEEFMLEASERVSGWPKWKQNIRIMDRYRQYGRSQCGENSPGAKKEPTEEPTDQFRRKT